MKSQTETHPALKALADQIGGEIIDNELYYGPTDGQIFISTEDGTEFYLASKRLLYSLKNGRPKRALPGTKGEDKDWYGVTISADRVRAALDLALSHTDPADKAVEFAYESILRDYLVDHLSAIEPGLQLYQKDDVRGVEFPAGTGFIDILTTDSKGALVIVEIKLSRGRRNVVGQIGDYIGWVRQHVAQPSQPVRGIIIARNISQDLRRSVGILQDVSLMEYELSITLKKVTT